MSPPPKPCLVRMCPQYAPPGQSRCDAHQRQWESERRKDPTSTGYRNTTALWLRARDAALRRARHRCERCGARGTRGAPLEVHHVVRTVPLDHSPENLSVRCKPCHKAEHRRRT
jgi:hypothetical protein